MDLKMFNTIITGTAESQDNRVKQRRAKLLFWRPLNEPILPDYTLTEVPKSSLTVSPLLCS
ncbi:hypothetical protein J6590_080950 [Homalodisca vitripennis]|nr:hypothetical protein J6590_080950 [Homalodisca vitripennis]